MAYQIPPDLEEQIRLQMSNGNYDNEDDVLRDALRALDAQNADLAAVQAGVDDMEAGRTRPLTVVADEIRKKHGWTSDS